VCVCLSECVHVYLLCCVYGSDTVRGCYARHVHRVMSGCVCVRACVCACECECECACVRVCCSINPACCSLNPPPSDSLALLNSARTHILPWDTCIIPSPFNTHMIFPPLWRAQNTSGVIARSLFHQPRTK